MGEGRKPLLVAGEGVSPQKPVAGMPTFGSMRSGVSFKNAVAQHTATAKEAAATTTTTKTPTISEATAAPGGGASLKFGSLPLRVQSAPPELKEERSAAVPVAPTADTPAANPKAVATPLESTPEEAAPLPSVPSSTAPRQHPSAHLTPALAETAQPFVPSGEMRPYPPPHPAYYGGAGMNYAAGPYMPMPLPYYGNRHYGGHQHHQGGFYAPPTHSAAYHHQHPHHHHPSHAAGGYPPPSSQGFRPYVPYQAAPPARPPQPAVEVTNEPAPSTAAPVSTSESLPPATATAEPSDAAATAAPTLSQTPALPTRQPSRRIQIVDPNTGKEVELGSAPKTVAKPVAAPESEEASPSPAPAVASLVAAAVVPPVAATVVPPVAATVAPPVAATAATTTVPAATASPQVALPPRKPIVLVDPVSNQEIDLNALVSTTSKSVQDAAHSGERIELLDGIDDDVIFSGSESDEESEEEESDEEFELPEGVQFPVILTRSIKVSYPEGAIPFKYPPEGEPLRYTSDFLLQFQPHCKGDAQDFATVAFPKDLPEHGARRREERRGTRHSRHSAARQYTAEQLTLSNRSSDAWKRSGAMVLDEELVLLREVKQILNKLTEDKFELLTKQILALDILKSAVMTGVIDMLFDKAVEEPRYAPLYARLCLNITRFEAEQIAKLLPAEEKTSAVKQSMFRGHLVAKCQIEYNEKRAYSKRRLERLKTKELAEAPEGESTKDTKRETAPAKPQYSGELTEEDYVLIKTKRRVLGNMRFIGELYLAGLIGPKIMHSVIQELLADVENPEEEEVESVCRLISTIGAHLDTAESAPLWAKYVERLRRLSTNTVLPTRVRFMVQDVLELRVNGWRKVVPAPPPAASVSSSAAGRRGERVDHRDRDGRRDRRESGDARRPSASLGAPGGGRFASGNQDVRLERSAGSGPAPRIQIKSSRSVSGDQLPRPSGPARASQESVNRYHALDEETGAEVPSSSATAEAVVDEKTLAKLASVFDEALKQKNYPDVLAIVEEIPANLRGAALKALVLHTMDKGRGHVNALLADILPLLIGEGEGRLIDPPAAVAGLREALELLDDLVVDIPSAFEFAGSYAAALMDAGYLDLNVLVDTVLEGVLERDTLSVAKVVLYAIKSSRLDEGRKRAMIASAKDALSKCVFEPGNKSSVEALATKLEISNLLA